MVQQPFAPNTPRSRRDFAMKKFSGFVCIIKFLLYLGRILLLFIICRRGGCGAQVARRQRAGAHDYDDDDVTVEKRSSNLARVP